MIDDEKGALTRACVALIKEVVTLLASHLGTTGLPQRSIPFSFFAPSGPGRYTGKTLAASDADWAAIWDFLDSELYSLAAYEGAANALHAYIDANRIEASAMWGQDIHNQYLKPLLQYYLTRKGMADYHRAVATSVVTEMVRHLQTPYVEITSLLVLEDFSAERSFTLDPTITARPITEDELMVLGREDWKYGLYTTRPGTLQPRSDWWVCEVQTKNPRGTAEGWNAANDVQANLGLALRAFKGGRLRLGLATRSVRGVFGKAGQILGSRLEAISSEPQPYRLSSREIVAFRAFWRNLIPLLAKESHYLHVPIRRLRAAGTRQEQEDALVDYVVGLEALLGKADERTELGFRFKTRGAVVLASRKSDRQKWMKTLETLYNLRSRIVHGQTVRRSELESALPIAEEGLRRIWHWYFRNFRTHPDNGAGVQRIDELLVG